MTSPYYVPGTISKNTLARAEAMQTEFDAVETALDKLPTQVAIKDGTTPYIADTGTANTMLVALTNTAPGYVTGMLIAVKVNVANTGATTINVDSQGVKSVVRNDGGAMASGDLTAGAIIEMRYDGTDFQVMGYGSGATAAAASAAAAEATLAAAMQASLFDANTILYATTDDTPVALPVAASRILGRKASGGIAALTTAELKTLTSYITDLVDDTTPELGANLDAKGYDFLNMGSQEWNTTNKGNLNSSTTITVADNAKQKFTITGNFTLVITFSASSGDYQELDIEVVNGGAFTITWPTINWLVGDGSTSTTFADMNVTLESSGTNHVLVWTTDGGTTKYGVAG